MNDAELNGPAQWGKLIALSHDRGQGVFELDFGHGHKVITFVTFTTDVARDLADGANRGGHFQK